MSQVTEVTVLVLTGPHMNTVLRALGKLTVEEAITTVDDIRNQTAVLKENPTMFVQAMERLLAGLKEQIAAAETTAAPAAPTPNPKSKVMKGDVVSVQ
jgi:hypothetical protein